MAISRIYVNSQNRTNKTDNPANFTVVLRNTVLNIRDIELTSMTIESLWFHPTIPDYEKNVHMNVTGIGAITLTIDTRKLFNTPSDLVTELNTLYQTETSTADEPFVYDSDTKRITIRLTATFTIDPDAVDSMFERLGYSPGDLKSSATVGANQEITLSSSPNMLRTSLIYVATDFVNDATDVSGKNNIMAVIPLESSEYGWVNKFEQGIDNNTIKNLQQEIQSITVFLYDDKMEPLTMQPNALVALQFHVEHKEQDLNKDGVPDGRVRYPNLGLYGM